MSGYTTTNGEYGKPWVSTQGQHPLKTQSEIKNYREVAESDLMQKTGLKILKAKIMREKLIEDLENGEPEPYTYDPCVQYPKVVEFKIKAEEIKYPSPGLEGTQNPMYMTRNREYGRVQPSQQDISSKFFPITNKFTDSFVAERIPDTGLNTFLTPSRVHHLFDS
ncbi:hypothetical protein SteCoe_31851 [Stentor coeruleus]|uniref:Uncharacterized protein n=1 Tax=Stentor coeruleus TaxID=5963 RepID=A0A1R2B0C7_9CILI|nr:hypothetical protein SteCoe_31851 [Stentor coeruleus]